MLRNLETKSHVQDTEFISRVIDLSVLNDPGNDSPIDPFIK